MTIAETTMMANKGPCKAYLDDLDPWVVRYLASHPDAVRLIKEARQSAASGEFSADLVEAMREACDRSLEKHHNRIFDPARTDQSLAFYRQIESFASLENKVVMDFGCGIHECFAVAVVLWANGASHAIAVDEAGIESPEFTAKFLYHWIVRCMTSPHRYLWSGVRREQFVSRLSALGLEKLKGGTFEHIFTVLPLLHMTGKNRLDSLADGKINYVFSQSVLEHLQDPYGSLSQIHKKMGPNGIFCCAIDYRDCRHYAAGASPWEYLFDDGDYQPGHLNKLRHSAMMKIVHKAGFSVISEQVVREALPPSIYEGILPKYKDLSKEDISTTACYLVLRRRALPATDD